MDGLIIGTTFVIVTLLFIKIGEKIDRWFTRRSQSPTPQPIPTKVGMVSLPPLGVTAEEMQKGLIALGKALGPIDITLKDDPKPAFLTQEEWFEQTEKEFEEAWNQRFSEEMTGTANAGKLLIPGIKTHQ